MLEVRDHGPGLPEEIGDKVFERFWRADQGRRRGPGGAGLGLAIVNAIVQAHHGEVHARNAPDGGAIFRVELPAGDGPQRNQELRRSTPDRTESTGRRITQDGAQQTLSFRARLAHTSPAQSPHVR